MPTKQKKIVKTRKKTTRKKHSIKDGNKNGSAETNKGSGFISFCCYLVAYFTGKEIIFSIMTALEIFALKLDSLDFILAHQLGKMEYRDLQGILQEIKYQGRLVGTRQRRFLVTMMFHRGGWLNRDYLQELTRLRNLNHLNIDLNRIRQCVGEVKKRSDSNSDPKSKYVQTKTDSELLVRFPAEARWLIARQLLPQEIDDFSTLLKGKKAMESNLPHKDILKIMNFLMD